jgi:hypothetical protein
MPMVRTSAKSGGGMKQYLDTLMRRSEKHAAHEEPTAQVKAD